MSAPSNPSFLFPAAVSRGTNPGLTSVSVPVTFSTPPATLPPSLASSLANQIHGMSMSAIAASATAAAAPAGAFPSVRQAPANAFLAIVPRPPLHASAPLTGSHNVTVITSHHASAPGAGSGGIMYPAAARRL